MATPTVTSASPADTDPSQVQVLYADNLADDDFLWIVRCSTDAFFRLIESPGAWVTALAKLPGWRYAGSDEPAPAAILLRDFAMVVREAKVPDPDGWVIVQGISHTNELTVSVSREAAVRSVAAIAPTTEDTPFQSFWELVSYDKDNPPSYKKRFPVTIVRTMGRFYGHFEIYHPGEGTSLGASRTAAFLLAAAVDREGYARMLSSLDQIALYADSGTVAEGKRIEIKPGRIGSSIVYASVETASWEATNDDPLFGCNVVDGETEPPPPPAPGDPTDPTSGTADGSIVKLYKTPPPPGP